MSTPEVHRWYQRAAWKRRARLQLTQFPLCAICLREGKLSPAQIADHVQPHRGDSVAFWRGALQSLCVQCHNASKQREELRGYDTAIGADGLPLDPRHPFNRQA